MQLSADAGRSIQFCNITDKNNDEPRKTIKSGKGESRPIKRIASKKALNASGTPIKGRRMIKAHNSAGRKILAKATMQKTKEKINGDTDWRIGTREKRHPCPVLEASFTLKKRYIQIT